MSEITEKISVAEVTYGLEHKVGQPDSWGWQPTEIEEITISVAAIDLLWDDRLREELRRKVTILEANDGYYKSVFAYPNGSHAQSLTGKADSIGVLITSSLEREPEFAKTTASKQANWLIRLLQKNK